VNTLRKNPISKKQSLTMKQFLRLSSIITMACMAIVFLSSFTGLPLVGSTAVVLTVGSIVPMPKNALNGVIIETWANYIIERFFKDNQFLRFAYDDSQYVLTGRIVHIPQPGAKPAVVKNRNSFPATAVRRTDTDVVYALDEYSTDPTHIPNIDQIHLSYNKQDSVLGDHMQVLDETVADDMIIKWAGNATIVETTGAAVAPIGAQTGNRKGFGHQDLKKLMIRMNADNVPKNDRYVLIDDNMYEFFYDSLSDTNAKDFSRYADAENGVIGKLHGFNIMTRSSVLAATSANAIKALGAALAASDGLCSLAWQKNSVAFALGNTQLFQDTNNPLYYGDIYSTLVMAGGRVRRDDGKGVYVIKQAASA
jgi:hypothetical protein